MKTRTSLCLKTLTAATVALLAGPAAAVEEGPRSAILEAGRPFYVSPMVSTVFTDSKRASQDGMGAALAVGTRLFDFLAVEASSFVSRHKPDAVALTGSDRHATGYGGSVLVFPFGGKLANAYAVAGVHYVENSDAPATGGTLTDYDGIAYDAGVGLLAPINFLGAPAAFRVEGRYRAETHDEDNVGSEGEDLFADVALNFGLLVPLFWSEPPPPVAAAEPASVVPVADSDSDGVADDGDQCPDSAAGSTVEAGGCAPAAAEAAAPEAVPEAAPADAAAPEALPADTAPAADAAAPQDGAAAEAPAGSESAPPADAAAP